MSALDVALRFLATRPRSQREVHLRLRRAGVTDTEIQAVLEQLRAHGLLDDAAFAAYWVDQRQTFRPRGARLLRAELRQRGVDAASAEGAAAAVASSADQDAYCAAARRAHMLRTADERTFKTRLGQFLGRRGFDWDTISPVVDRLWHEASTSLTQGEAPAEQA